MEKMNLRKGLFGYTESSVVAYIEAINGEMKARIQKLTEENDGKRKDVNFMNPKKIRQTINRMHFLKKLTCFQKKRKICRRKLQNLQKKYQISIQDLMKQQRINLIMRKVRANLLT